MVGAELSLKSHQIGEINTLRQMHVVDGRPESIGLPTACSLAKPEVPRLHNVIRPSQNTGPCKYTFSGAMRKQSTRLPRRLSYSYYL